MFKKVDLSLLRPVVIAYTFYFLKGLPHLYLEGKGVKNEK